MAKICLIIILIASSVNGLKVSNEICRPSNGVTVCQDVTLKENEPLEIENCTKILKLQSPLKEIPQGVFAKLPGLESLVINFTLMKKIYSHSFDGLENLRELDLYFNQLSNIPLDAFHGCRNLTYLNLGGNDFENINGDVFLHLKRLKELIISSNLLTSVPKLGNLDSLQLLDLSKNKIRKLDKDSFNGLVSLINLNLRGNQIYFIELDAFRGLTKLKYLNLERNVLDDSFVVENIMTTAQNLKELRLNMNQFSCNGLRKNINNIMRRGIFIPQGLAEPGPISYHGIFCIPKKNDFDKEYYSYYL